MATKKEEEIIAVINKMRPYIQRDGGDVEFSKFEDGVVYVKMSGACMDCLALDDTITFGIEAMLKDEVEGVNEVQVEQTEMHF
ncbi:MULTISPECIES: NifU family protein [Breznakia]|uniref:Fe-S cluster biogenesis protein NfuA n=1 Tax=Breznakia blatticola TaxID=1754012 RepID=A0A4R7ZSN6_9FIRM|nr:MULTISPECIES: NifU family protein [Breznakia]MDH6366435.1 Fe-S cluster biogenesis protein NfuA [Breznakia sp. PH1-1]MDH6403528.1 Fe-S cluster biogenesis protein NfuA [Breznakia sp. PF1-11]MDH6411237.1 Fe-S cluster biogenesis protein NfuA [Breznakia sp. PFB1-11]MDH6413500.1 Fe-S cluster biogenesis protein NfuA [Breznakia sp. PFB1-14]MDH6415782.1 Fe-S cluster biogenesis protein NfuA [Breznakia sp. PFB1-4]